MAELTAFQILIVDNAFKISATKCPPRVRDDIFQLAWQYILGRKTIDWSDSESIRSCARNAIGQAIVEFAKKYSFDKRFTLIGLEHGDAEPYYGDAENVDYDSDWSDEARTIATSHAIPQPMIERPAIVTHAGIGQAVPVDIPEFDVELLLWFPANKRKESTICYPVSGAPGASQLMLRIKAIKTVRRTRKTHDSVQHARIRREACNIAVDTGHTLVLNQAIGKARIRAMADNRLQAELQTELEAELQTELEQKQSNRSSFRLNRMFRELLAQ